jgi:hypothetical protein
VPYSSEMYSSLDVKPLELDVLIRRFQERRELVPLKARGLKSLGVELQAAYALGLPWKAIWRALRDAGYQGTYRQFVSMTMRLAHGPLQQKRIRKNLVPPNGEKAIHQAVVQRGDRKPETGEKPEWQRQREEIMARLDREAEQNREREARQLTLKRFSMTPFAGRGEA